MAIEATDRRHPHGLAQQIAESLVADLQGSCERIAIAGSIRRGEPFVKDIELVAVPKMRLDLFGEPLEGPTALDLTVNDLVAEQVLRPREPRRMGERYKALQHIRSGLPVDLFVVKPPAQWGAILAIRTGPSDYSKRLVTSCKERYLECRQGRLVNARGAVVETPEEDDFIRACGLEPVEPARRR